jgi:very-short-patch-repair endonuclease
MAAVLAVGDGAVLSHRSAARLWTIDPQERALSRPAEGAASETVDITVPAGGGRAQRNGIRLHRSRTLSLSDCTLRQGIPVTTPARTLQDLRHVLPRTQFAQAVRQASFHGLSVGNDIPTDHTRSELEARFLALLRRHRLPQPEVNVQVDRFVVDFLWRPQRLVVELDGWQSHRGRAAFEEDRARDARLKLLDYEVLRFTWRQVLSAPAEVAATVQTLLGR